MKVPNWGLRERNASEDPMTAPLITSAEGARAASTSELEQTKVVRVPKASGRRILLAGVAS